MAMEVFLGAVGRLAEGNCSAIDLFGVTGELLAKGRLDLAAQLYKLWIGLNPGSSVMHAVCFNQGVVATNAGDLVTARSAYERAIVADPDFIPARINLGGVLERQGAIGEAVACWNQALERMPAVTGHATRLKLLTLRQLGRVMEGNPRQAAESALRQMLDLDPREGDVGEQYLALRLLQCKWPVAVPPEGMSRETLLRSMHPLTGSAYADHPLFQLGLNWNYNKNRIGYPLRVQDPSPEPDQPGKGAKKRRLRIGYLSSDFCAHAVGYLMVEAMERHDREKVEIFVYYNGPAATDWINARTRMVAEHWLDIQAMDDETVAGRMVEDKIDILVDLNGNTKGSRTRVCAMRPAPVIVNWLGYPGTMGSPYHHYIIADDWIIPEGYEIFYSEKVLRLPCYQPNDSQRQVAVHRPTRAEAGLPEEAMVYCCFNWTQKFNKKIFALWMQILHAVPGSVLWFLDTDTDANAHITGLAGQHGIAPERIIFGKWMASPDHLARYPLADLFLDTFPYGAHTTASDALWMGVPILTLSGHSFASRVCGSLTRAAGLPDTVCASPAEYVARAVELGHNPALVLAYKDRLKAAHDSCVLFDTDGLMRRLEALYARIWADHRAGKTPTPNLANLDVYLELAVEDDIEAIDIPIAPDAYRDWFREKLARRDKVCSLPSDGRLWP